MRYYMRIGLWFAMSLIFFISEVSAIDYYSGDTYTFSSSHSQNYIYKWSASEGSYSESDKSTFLWTAPDVDSSREAVISLSVTDITCDCRSKGEMTLTILPREENSTEEDSKSINSTSNEEEISSEEDISGNESSALQLTFDDGTQIAVEFTENNLGTYVASVSVEGDSQNASAESVDGNSTLIDGNSTLVNGNSTSIDGNSTLVDGNSTLVGESDGTIVEGGDSTSIDGDGTIVEGGDSTSIDGDGTIVEGGDSISIDGDGTIVEESDSTSIDGDGTIVEES